MKLVFITTRDNAAQGDLLEVSILHGLRSVLGSSCIDFPKKKTMYHDWSLATKESLHGRGFTLYNSPLLDLTEGQRELKDIDAVLYGVSNMYNETNYPHIDKLVDPSYIFYLDGHDLYGEAPKKIHFEGEHIIATQKSNCFKRELVEAKNKVWPTGFGIPKEQISPLNFQGKSQLFQKTAPDDASFRPVQDMGGGSTHHVFSHEKSYYKDISSSWFGLTCKKGGWDCLRHYEIIAAGALLLFKDYNKKPSLCSPQGLPCFSYSSAEELENLFNALIIQGKPTKEYIEMLLLQRRWLWHHGTTEARALNILRTINEQLSN